jgi:hypothetical protein
MTTPVPIPQDATVGFDQPQQLQQSAPMGASASAGKGVVPIPTDATVGFGEPQGAKTPSQPEGQTAVGAALGTEPIKTSDIPLPSKKATGGYLDRTATSVPIDWSGLKGLGQDLMGAAKGAVSGVIDVVKPPQNDTEKYISALGPEAVPIYRVLVGAGHSAKDAAQIVDAVKEINQSNDPLGAYAKVVQKTSSQGGAQAILALATEGALKAAPKVTGAISDTIKGKLNPSAVQEPLQTGVKSIIDESTADIPKQSPKTSYEHDSSGKLGNLDHRVTTTDASGKKIGELAAQGDDPTKTVTVRSNQIYDKANRGRGYGKAQIQTLAEEAKNSGQKFVKSDISTTTDAQRVWEKLQKEHPDAITRKDFKPETAEGAPESDVTKSQWTIDLDKYTPPEATPLKPPSQSIRNASHEAGDRIMAESKADYEVLDQESGGRVQRLRDKIDANRRRMRDLTSSEADIAEESRILKSQKEIEDEMGDMYDEMKKKGIPADLIDRADRNFRRAQGAYDVGDAIRKNTTGAHPDVSRADLVKDAPETLDPKGFHRTINRMYDSGRLQDFLGEAGANKMFDLSLEHHANFSRIMRNRKIAFMGGGAAAGAGLGTGGYYAHRMLGSLETK